MIILVAAHLVVGTILFAFVLSDSEVREDWQLLPTSKRLQYLVTFVLIWPVIVLGEL
jgi:hypothetical protein